MNVNKGICGLLLILLLCIICPAFAQTVEQRLDTIEAKLDSLLAILKGQALRIPLHETVSDNLHLLYGIATHTGTIMNKEFFVINHNNDWKIPYWVAYYLSQSNLQGDAERTDNFRPDPELPIGSRAELEDYRNSGYDRGHNAPAASFKRSREAMSTTFLLSNMSPQRPGLNRYIWKDLEEDVRELVMEKGEAWIVTGNLSLSADSQCICPRVFIGPGEHKSVAVPTHCYKTILAREETGISSTYAFLIPNQFEQIPGGPSDYMITLDRLEEITGYDFFPLLADSIENDIEDEVLSWSW